MRRRQELWSLGVNRPYNLWPGTEIQRNTLSSVYKIHKDITRGSRELQPVTQGWWQQAETHTHCFAARSIEGREGRGRILPSIGVPEPLSETAAPFLSARRGYCWGRQHTNLPMASHRTCNPSTACADLECSAHKRVPEYLGRKELPVGRCVRNSFRLLEAIFGTRAWSLINHLDHRRERANHAPQSVMGHFCSLPQQDNQTTTRPHLGARSTLQLRSTMSTNTQCVLMRRKRFRATTYSLPVSGSKED